MTTTAVGYIRFSLNRRRNFSVGEECLTGGEWVERSGNPVCFIHTRFAVSANASLHELENEC